MKEQILIGTDWAFRLLLAAIFLYAAWPKMMAPTIFAKAIANYKVVLPLVGQDYIFLTAIILPPLEAVAAIGLFLARFRRAGALIITLMMALFTVLILQAVLRGLNIDCGCYGTSDAASALAHKVGWSKILQNLGMLTAAIFVYKRACPPKPRYRL